MDIGTLLTGAAILIAGVLLGVALGRNSSTANKAFDKVEQELREIKARLR
jgi:uncharacterized membrane-anchored protein YhcB (DUF1043 family)